MEPWCSEYMDKDLLLPRPASPPDPPVFITRRAPFIDVSQDSP